MQVHRQEDIRECKAIELRSGKELPDLYKFKAPEEEKQKGSPGMERENEDGCVEALEQMPNYAKFMKQILSKKRWLEEFETVALNEKCSAIL